MKRILVALANILTAALLIGAYSCAHYASIKLGMVRWLNYHNAEICEALPIDALRFALATVLGLAALAIVLFVWKNRRDTGWAAIAGTAVMTATVLVFLLAIVFVNEQATKAWILVSLLMGCAAAVQVLYFGALTLLARRK